MEQPRAPGSPQHYIAINDLLVYGAVLTRPTGIQRVALNLALALHDLHGYQGVRIDNAGARFIAIPRSSARSPLARLADPLLRLLSHAPRAMQEFFRSTARRLLSRLAGGGGGAAAIQRGDWVLVLGAPWIAPGMASAIVQLHERTGARIALLIHDLLPATSPDWFADAQGRTAKRDVEQLIGAAAQIFTVSREVGAELFQRYGRPSTLLNPADPVMTSASLRASNMERCVLSVGTLHPRKNLAALVRIWEAWAEEVEATTGSVASIPTLVIAGRRHPQDGELFSLLATNRRAASKIRLTHTASDAELADLYAASRFLVMPSLAEGWGLPVREALVAGRPSIVTDAVPAASGLSYCESVPAGDEAALGEAIRRWWESDTPERFSERIRSEYKARTWESVAADLSSQLDATG